MDIRGTDGRQWDVGPGDPAREAVNLLKRNHFTYVVLTDARLRGILKVEEAPQYSKLWYRQQDCEEFLSR